MKHSHNTHNTNTREWLQTDPSLEELCEKGKVRFNLLNGLIAQKLFFCRGLERKPVEVGRQ
jgi:stalled ribosome alternative rescue factor ArfA